MKIVQEILITNTVKQVYYFLLINLSLKKINIKYVKNEYFILTFILIITVNSNYYRTDLTLTRECDIVNEFNVITVEVDENEDCCVITDGNGEISCRNKHITAM